MGSNTEKRVPLVGTKGKNYFRVPRLAGLAYCSVLYWLYDVPVPGAKTPSDIIQGQTDQKLQHASGLLAEL